MFEAPALADLNLGVTWASVFLALYATGLLVADMLIPKEHKIRTAWLAIAGIVISFVLNLATYNTTDHAFFGMFTADPFSAFLNIVSLLAAFLSILLSVDYLKRTGIERGEFYPLILFTTSGIMFMGHANDLIVIFIGLELLSIPLYVMAALRYPDLKSEESGIKYFILGAFASAFFVYGAALIYGSTGTTNLQSIFQAVGTLTNGESNSSLTLLLLGAGLALVGLCFKVAAVPFHMWTPDVYEGAPTPVTAFMSVGAKVGGFASLLRLLIVALPALIVVDGQTNASWQQTVSLIAAATLILGNIVAIAQTNVKRMLAYSSIAHAGYVLMAVAAAGTAGVGDKAAQSAVVYLMAYMFTNLGAFAVALAIEKNDGTGTNISDFIGLSKSKPLLAIMMAVFMLSLTGIPLTAGFMGKWVVFQATLNAGLVWLALVGVLTSVVSAFYYVRIIVNMYLRDGEGDPAQGATPYVNWAVYVSFAGTLLLGIFPFLMLNLANPITLAFVTP
jgi:NADH-quinone oxidoreductase subunit N